MKITNLMLNPRESALSFLRAVIPFDSMRMLGCDVDFFDMNNFDLFNSENLKSSDILVLNREIPNIISAILINFCNENNIKIIYELDDNIFEIFDEHPFVDLYKNVCKGLKSVLKSVDGIVVSTDELRNKISFLQDNIFVYPNLLQESLIRKNLLNKKKNDRITLGYAGGLAHYKDTDVMFSLWDLLHSEFDTKLKFKIIGPIRRNLGDELKSNHIGRKIIDNIGSDSEYESNIEYIQGDKVYTEYLKILSFQNFDIGFAPLIANEFNNCKSNIKYLEYELFGTIGIYSNNRAYNTINKNFIEIAETEDIKSWFSKTKEIIQNYDFFYEKQKKHQEYAIKNFTIPNKNIVIKKYYEWLKLLEKNRDSNIEFIDKSASIAIIGTGAMGKFIFKILQNFGYDKVYFYDNYKQGEILFGQKIRDIKLLKSNNIDNIIIASNTFFQEIYAQLREFDFGLIELLRN